MTYEQVEETVAALQAAGLRVSATAILQRVGGSKRDVCRHLRELREMGSRSQDLIEPALVPEAALASDAEPMLVSPQCGSVIRYRVLSGRFFRTTEILGLVRIPKGTLLDDVTPEELAAFGDLLALVED